jgi:hypothetical protein
VTARLPFVAYFEGGPADRRVQQITPTEADGSFDVLRIPIPVTIKDYARALIDPDAGMTTPKVAEYVRVEERWLDLDGPQALMRDMPPGRHLVGAVYRYRRTV